MNRNISFLKSRISCNFNPGFVIISILFLVLANSPVNAELGFTPSDYSTALALTVNAYGSTIPPLFPVKYEIDMETLINNGEIREDGIDCRIVWTGGDDPVELDRFLYKPGTISTEIWFPVQAEIAPDESDDSYILYYGNPFEISDPPADPNMVFEPHLDCKTIALYHYEQAEGLTVTDYTGNGLHALGGPEHSPPGWGDGRFAGAMDFGFQSINNYADVSDDPLLRLERGTFETWVNMNVLGRNQGIISKDHVGFTNGGHITISWEQPQYEFQARIQSLTETYRLYGGGDTQPEEWVHVAFTFGPEGNNFYVNGLLADSGFYTGGIETNDNELTLGASRCHHPNPPYEEYLDGLLDGTRISSVQRTSFPYAEVTEDPVVTGEPVELPTVSIECCGLAACERGSFTYRIIAENPLEDPVILMVRIMAGPGIPEDISIYNNIVTDTLTVSRILFVPQGYPVECPCPVEVCAALVSSHNDCEMLAMACCDVEFIHVEN